MDGTENIWTTEAMTSSVNDNEEIVGYIEEVLNARDPSSILPNKLCDVTNILQKIERRLEIGIKRYGHGIIALDDTTKYGTKDNDWLEMMEEECLDALVYCAARIAQMKRMKYIHTPFNEHQLNEIKLAMKHILVALDIAESLRRETAP